MVLGKLPVPGRPTIWLTVGQGPAALAVGAGGGCLGVFALVCPFSPFSPSLWETARYRLKYCLKGPLNSKQPTNQPASLTFNIYFYLFLCLYITRKTIINGTSHLRPPKNQNRRAALGRAAIKVLPVSQFILPPGQVAPRGASQPWLACPPGGNLSRDILPPTLVTFTPGGQHIPAGLSCPPGVKLNQPGYLAPHP